MKNDILLFAILFAVAWFGFANLKGYLEPASTIDSPQSALANPASDQEALEDVSLAASPADSSLKPTDIQSGLTTAGGGIADDDSRPDDAADPSSDLTEASNDDSVVGDNDVKKSLSPATAELPQTIRQVIQSQVQAWNRGDLEGFMDAYWNNESLTVSGGGETTRGWDATYAKYRQRFPESEMGQIEFRDLEIDMVGDESAIVTGNFQHQLPQQEANGAFSLVLKKFDDQWKIIHDSTVEAP